MRRAERDADPDPYPDPSAARIHNAGRLPAQPFPTRRPPLQLEKPRATPAGSLQTKPAAPLSPESRRSLGAENGCAPQETGASDALLDHQLQQVAHPAAVPPLVVVPAHQLEEPLVQLDARALVKDG